MVDWNEWCTEMLTSLFLTVLLLGIAIWRPGFSFLVWVDLIISAANFAIFLIEAGL